MTSSAGAHRDRPRWWIFLPTVVVGWGIIAFGLRTAIDDPADAHPFALVVHIVTFDLVHDLFVAPVLFLGAWSIGKVVPAVARGPLRSAAAASALYVAIAYPLGQATDQLVDPATGLRTEPDHRAGGGLGAGARGRGGARPSRSNARRSRAPR